MVTPTIFDYLSITKRKNVIVENIIKLVICYLLSL